MFDWLTEEWLAKEMKWDILYKSIFWRCLKTYLLNQKIFYDCLIEWTKNKVNNFMRHTFPQTSGKHLVQLDVSISRYSLCIAGAKLSCGYPSHSKIYDRGRHPWTVAVVQHKLASGFKFLLRISKYLSWMTEQNYREYWPIENNKVTNARIL